MKTKFPFEDKGEESNIWTFEMFVRLQATTTARIREGTHLIIQFLI